MTDNSGHLDYWPNGGVYQPGCPIQSFNYFSNLSVSGLISGAIVGNTIYCSHLRVVDLFNDALLPNTCQSIAYQCDSYENFNLVHISL